MDIPKNKVLSEKKVGKTVISVRRRYVSALNQVCCLDSNYEYNYALYLDYLYETHAIAGWVRNTTAFGFSQPITVRGRAQNAYRPDFIVFCGDGTYEIHEVKGWMNEKSIEVDRQFRRDYPNLQYRLIGKDEMLSLQAQFGKKLWGWVDVR